jgi:hypothetical protein
MKNKKGTNKVKKKSGLKEENKDAKKEAAKSIFTIKGLLIYPYFVAVILSFLLIYICVLKNDPNTKIAVLVAVLIPFYYFFLELIFRKVVITNDYIFVRKFLRKRKISLDDIKQVGTACFRSKTYVFFELERSGPVIISNSYEKFGELLSAISTIIGENRLTDSLKNLPKSKYKRYSDILSAWMAVLLFVAIIVIRLSEN